MKKLAPTTAIVLGGGLLAMAAASWARTGEDSKPLVVAGGTTIWLRPATV